MGCDIHLMIERKKGEQKWSAFSYSQMNPGRDYRMFTAMAGVRCYNDDIETMEPKGFPEDAGWATVNEHSFYVSEEETDESGYTSRESAERWVSQKIAEWVDDKKHRVTDPDAHSQSWLTPDEFEKCLNNVNGLCDTAKYPVDPEYQAILAVLRTYEMLKYETRIVFWFDK